ncbi:AT-rich interactive domain-containing protein 5-like [Hibiscus syriacus]|uniref:AT-rich interactive domain-containing protein 5-like n=1 Tax=Hibiscus syriacus TaxID=106335 RepID=UPI00192480D4|nr:AT-rich interactive domain-containing protein 5-like [Hibiscus syriacus]
MYYIFFHINFLVVQFAGQVHSATTIPEVVFICFTQTKETTVGFYGCRCVAPADWVKVNVQKSAKSYEVYILVPGLLHEEVYVESDPAGRLVISGEPKQSNNPRGVAPFKKVVCLPSRIDPNKTSSFFNLLGQPFVRAPFEPSDV